MKWICNNWMVQVFIFYILLSTLQNMDKPNEGRRSKMGNVRQMKWDEKYDNN